MKYPFWKKIMVSALAVIILCQNAHALSERQSSLSSKSFLDDPEFRQAYYALAVVDLIIKTMRGTSPKIKDLFEWVNSTETIFEGCKPRITNEGELWIEGRGWLVRFFSPWGDLFGDEYACLWEDSISKVPDKWIRYKSAETIHPFLVYEIYLERLDSKTASESAYPYEGHTDIFPVSEPISAPVPTSTPRLVTRLVMELETDVEMGENKLLDRKTGTKAFYDTKGKIVSILDRNGNTIERRYYYVDGRLAYLELMNISGREEDKLTVEGITLPGMTGIGYDIWRQGEYIGFFSCVIGRDKKIFSIRNISCTNKSAAETMLMWLANGASMMNMSLEVVNLQPKIQLVPVIGKYLRPVIFIVVDAEEKRKLLGTVILGRKGLKLKLDDKKTSEAFLLTKDGAIIDRDTNKIIGWISEWLSGINIMGIPRRTFMTRAEDGSVCIEEGERQHVLDGETATQTSL